MNKSKHRKDPYIRSLIGKQLLAFVSKHPEIPWDYYLFSSNPNITMEIIEAYLDKPWNWYEISFNPNITMEFIEKYPDKPWNWYEISFNPNITMEFIEAHHDKPWDWYIISIKSFNGIYDQIEERYTSRLLLCQARKTYWASLT